MKHFKSTLLHFRPVQDEPKSHSTLNRWGRRMLQVAVWIMGLVGLAFISSTSAAETVRIEARGPNGARGIASGPDQHQAVIPALEICEAFARGAGCSVEIEGEAFVGSFSRESIDYTRRSFQHREVPFLWFESRERLLAYEHDRQPVKALAISGSGAWAWRSGSDLMMVKIAALNACRAENLAFEADVPCFVYAENLSVVMRESDIKR